MGRIVSCSKCGAWVEVEAGRRGDVLCEKCGGAAGRQEAPGGGIEAAKGRSPLIGPDSGPIGAGALGAGAATSVEAELPAATTGVGRQGPAAPRPEARGAPQRRTARAEAVKEAVKEKGREELSRVRQVAEDFGRRQAGQAVEEAREFAKDRGLRSVPEAGQFVKEQGRRIGREARDLAEQELKSAADRAAEAARSAVEKLGQKSETVVRRPGAPEPIGTCRLCRDRIVPGDRVIVCPECGSSYHGACYDLAGRCPTCAGRPRPEPGITVRPPSPGPTIPVARPTREAATKSCSSCGAKVSEHTLVCPQCGRWLYSGRQTSRDPRAAKDFPAGCTTVALVVFIVALVIWVAAYV